MTKETITISYVGKFGPSVDGVWYNVDQKSGLKPGQFEKGKTYTVLVSVSKTGKKYIQQIIGESNEAAPEVREEKSGDDKILQAPITTASSGGSSLTYSTYGKRDFEAEARGKVACAAYTAALQSPGLAMYATSKEEYLKIVAEAALAAIEFTWTNQKA